MFKQSKLIVLVSTAILMTACTTNYVKPQNYTTFLKDYSELNKVDLPSKNQALVWSNDQVGHYSKVIYTPIKYHNPQNVEYIPSSVRDEILDYSNVQIQNALSQDLALTQQMSKEALIFRGTITRIDTHAKKLKPFEYLPVMFVVASSQYASGTRDRRTELYFEGELVDSMSKQSVYKVVIKVSGKNLENKKSQLQMYDVKDAIDRLSVDIASLATEKTHTEKSA